MPDYKNTTSSPLKIGEKLINWYDTSAREMPWRSPPPNWRTPSPTKIKQNAANPYHVFLSEVMLQQTQVATVIDYFNRFITRWPTVEDLANAALDDVLSQWAGLGYYSRARNLKKTANIIISEHQGNFPQSYEALIKLPGIGDYTASAIAAIAFQQPIAVVDGNVERIITRLEMIETPLPKAKPQIKALLAELLKHEPINQRPGDLAQSFMDLGATICTAKTPQCEHCPIAQYCKAKTAGKMLNYPKKLAKKPKPTRKGACFIAQNSAGAIWLEKRPDKGMLAEMSAPPSSDWHVNGDGATGCDAAPIKANWQMIGMVKHTFTHFHLELDIYLANTDKTPDREGWWSNANRLAHEAIPTLFTKALKLIK